MSKATATCTCEKCGKTFEITAYRRNRADANEFEKWVKDTITICQDCERLEKDQAIRSKAEELGLPALTGSEKQIKWAMSIRDEFLSDAERWEARFGDDIASADIFKRQIKIIVDAKTTARWWIDLKTRHRCSDVTAVEETIMHSSTDEDKSLFNAIVALN